MRNWIRSAGLLTTSLTLSCVAETAGFHEVSDATDQRLQQAQHLSQKLPWPNLETEPASVLDAETHAALQRPLEIEDALRIAVLHSPKVRLAFARLGVSRAELLGAYRPSNPYAELAVRFGQAGTSVEVHAFQNLTNLILLPLQVSSAKVQTEAARLESVELLLSHLFQVKALYIEWLAASRLHRLELDLVEAQRASALAADELFQAGNLREPLRLSELSLQEDAELEAARTSLLLARAELQLKEALGLVQDVGLRAPDALPDWSAVQPEVAVGGEAPKLEEQALTRSLTLKAIERRYTATVKAANLSTLRGWLPGVGAGVAAEHESQGWNVGPAFAFSVPLVNQGQGATARHEAMARQLRARWLEVAGLVRTQTRSALITAEQSGVSHRRIVEQLLPARAELLERTQREFNAMLIGVFDLLQVKRAQIQAQKAEIRWHREQLLSATRLEQLLAGSLPQPVNLSSLSSEGSQTANSPGTGEHGAH